MCIRLKRKSPSQAHRPTAIALHKHRRHAAAERITVRRQRPRHLLPNNYPTQRWGDNCIDSRIRKQSSQRLPQLFCKSRILQNKRTLRVGAAVEAARQLKMTMADRSRLLKQLKSSSRINIGPLTAEAPKRRNVSS